MLFCVALFRSLSPHSQVLVEEKLCENSQRLGEVFRGEIRGMDSPIVQEVTIHPHNIHYNTPYLLSSSYIGENWPFCDPIMTPDMIADIFVLFPGARKGSDERGGYR